MSLRCEEDPSKADVTSTIKGIPRPSSSPPQTKKRKEREDVKKGGEELTVQVGKALKAIKKGPEGVIDLLRRPFGPKCNVHTS